LVKEEKRKAQSILLVEDSLPYINRISF